jgi:hypothetical protein
VSLKTQSAPKKETAFGQGKKSLRQPGGGRGTGTAMDTCFFKKESYKKGFNQLFGKVDHRKRFAGTALW